MRLDVVGRALVGLAVAMLLFLGGGFTWLLLTVNDQLRTTNHNFKTESKARDKQTQHIIRVLGDRLIELARDNRRLGVRQRRKIQHDLQTIIRLLGGDPGSILLFRPGPEDRPGFSDERQRSGGRRDRRDQGKPGERPQKPKDDGPTPLACATVGPVRACLNSPGP